MANTTTSPNMGLVIPTVGVDPGPDWANNINASLGIVDQHNHTTGQGVPINPAGLNINSDLTFGGNNAIALRSVRFNAQASPLSGGSDLGCLYFSGVDAWANDLSGNQIQLTVNGGVAGTPGSIANLVSPASASWVALASSFVWQSASNTPANLDCASVILRNLSSGSYGLTLQPPTLSVNYALTLPPLPPGKQIMALDSSGNITAPYTVDSSTVVISSNVIMVPSGGITPTQLSSAVPDWVGENMDATGANAVAATMTSTGADAIAATMDATGANAIAATMNSTGANSIGASMSATGANDVANSRTRAAGSSSEGVGGVCKSGPVSGVSTGDMGLSCTITTSGRPVRIFTASGSATESLGSAGAFYGYGAGANGYVSLRRGGSPISVTQLGAGSSSSPIYANCNPVDFIDVVGAGTYTYTCYFHVDNPTMGYLGIVLFAYEL